MRSVLLFCAILMSYAAIGNETLNEKELFIKEIKEKERVSIEKDSKLKDSEPCTATPKDILLINSKKEECGYTCSPCMIITVTCCGNSIQAQYCSCCHHGSYDSYNMGLCMALCNMQ